MIRFFSIGILFVVALLSCERGVVVSEKWEWKDKRWVLGDQKTMVLEGMDTSTVYEMNIRVDHEESYKFQNLYIRTRTIFPSGKEVTSVTSLELVNEDGSWAGDHGENCCSVTLPLQRRFTFPEIGKFTWSVEPYMRMDTVEGIKALKVKVKKVKE